MKKTFILMRHAKSDWQAGVNSDFERPLNARGKEASQLVGEYFKQKRIVPDKILHSSAKRTTETTELLFAAAEWDAKRTMIEKSDHLYLCSPYQLMQAVLHTDNQVNTLLVVNHQPTCGEIVAQLCNQWVDFKTASFAIIEAEIEDWGLLESCDKIDLRHRSPAQLKGELSSRWEDGEKTKNGSQ